MTKDTCDLSGSRYSSEGTLLRHKQLVHGEMPAEPEYDCLECGIKFSRKDNLNRHRKENHYDASKANYDFVEDLDRLKIFQCDQCDEGFKKKSDLQRHYSRAHSEIGTEKNFECDQSEKKYSRKDNLIRHVKSAH